MNKQKGFSLIVLLLSIIAVCAVVGVGYYVYSSQKENKPAVNSAGTAQQVQNTTQTIPKADEQKYLVIKEWGIKIPVDDSVKGLAYKTSPGVPGGYGFVTDEYIAITNDCTSSTVFLVRGKANERLLTETGEGQGPTFAENYKADNYANYPASPRSVNLNLGSYYYAYPLMGAGTCTGGTGNEQKEINAVEKIVKSLKKAQLVE